MTHPLPPNATWAAMALLAAAAIGITGCAAPGVDSSGRGGRDIPPGAGKYDNYISSTAREFILSGTTRNALPADFATRGPSEQDDAKQKTIDTGLATLSRSLRAHIDERTKEANGPVADEDAPKEYFTYFKSGNHEAADATVVGNDVEYAFEIELVGSPNLANMLADDQMEGGTFALEVDGTSVVVSIRGTPSTDAFPRYNELFADGVYDIAVHFGGDYNDERYDLETAKWLVDELIKEGWSNPEVDSFDTLTFDSPPFTRDLTVERRAVQARVFVVHAGMDDANGDQERLGTSMRDSLANADVVIYSGHAGPGAGFILDYDPRFEIDNKEFKELALADKYQIYVFDGCETYRTYVDDILKNPNKTFDNLDVITTVNTTPFSAGYQVLWQFMYWLTLTDGEGEHFPLTWKTILQGINVPDIGDVHYGVHGLDSNPKINPNGGTTYACQSCDDDSECGSGGNFCLNIGGDSVCGIACSDTTACPDGFVCRTITEDPDEWYFAKQCVPTSDVCR